MKTAIAIMASLFLMVLLGSAGCEGFRDRDRDRVYVEQDRSPVIVERERAPVYIERRDSPPPAVRIEVDRR